FLSFAFIVPLDLAEAKEDKELQKQRNSAQKERQESRNERNRDLADATKSFREMTRNLKSNYQARLKDLDTEFELKQVELQADRDAKMATAEAEYQKKWSSLFMRPGGPLTPETIKELEKEARAYSDELFRLKKESAETAHKEKMAIEEQKHALLKEMDEKAMDQAASLGLTKEYPPILATPIGDELTRSEQQWNEREKKEVEKIQERNLQAVSEFMNGEKLREWERGNLDEDFKLTWDEKSELQKLETQQTFFNTLLMQSAQAEKVDQQNIMDQFAELAKEQKLIKIKYAQLRKTNVIKRREEKKKLQGR
ncbi:MAG: hypothetical protein OEW26_05625, partial [Nitrospirota bacterium]|nr:hypothetical protein [Nitrospirota bacterium]